MKKLFIIVIVALVVVMTLAVFVSPAMAACDLNVTSFGMSSNSGQAGAAFDVYGTYTGTAAPTGDILYVLPSDQTDVIGTFSATGGNISGTATIPLDATEGGHLIDYVLPFSDATCGVYGPIPISTYTVVGGPVARDYYWTWYDQQSRNMTDWVLMGNPSTTSTLSFSLNIAGNAQIVGDLGYGEGKVGPQETLTSTYPGVMGGPVKVSSLTGEKGFVSQRVLFGNSFEEIPGIEESQLSGHYYWAWYDQQSPGMLNWVLVANPSTSDDVYYQIKIAGDVKDTGKLVPGDKVTPTFPGVLGGPVEVTSCSAAFDQYGNCSGTNPKVIASQRVLSNYGTAFNEVPGIPANELSGDYLWTWYDNQSPGATDWVLVANPSTSDDVYYQIKIAGDVKDTGKLVPGDKVTPTFPGVLGGPVEVTSCSAAFDQYGNCSGTNPKVIASQRSIWGPSFEEVPGMSIGSLSWDYGWTWYDQKSPGSTNWILVANPGDTPVDYQIIIGGQVMPTSLVNPGTISAHGRVTPTFPGVMGGPVEIVADGKVIASQRVLWNGYFNEVLGRQY